MNRVFIVGLDKSNLEEIKELLRICPLIYAGKTALDFLHDKELIKDHQVIQLKKNLQLSLQSLKSSSCNSLVLASGDPGYFGILRTVRRMINPKRIITKPGISSIAKAFSRLNLPWDDALIVSAHGRKIEVLKHALSYPKVAVLTSPFVTPEKIFKFFLEHKIEKRLGFIASNLDFSEQVAGPSYIKSLVDRNFDPYSVVIIYNPDQINDGLITNNMFHYIDSEFLQLPFDTESQIDLLGQKYTKPEIRDLALSKLNLRPTGIFFDLGSGTGSVAITTKIKFPFLTVYAVENDPKVFNILKKNIKKLNLEILTIKDDIKNALNYLPEPDYVFLGGGGLQPLVKLLNTTNTAKIVASYASLDRALKAADLLGNLIEVNCAVGKRFPDNTWHLSAYNPVFLAFN